MNDQITVTEEAASELQATLDQIAGNAGRFNANFMRATNEIAIYGAVNRKEATEILLAWEKAERRSGGGQ